MVSLHDLPNLFWAGPPQLYLTPRRRKPASSTTGRGRSASCHLWSDRHRERRRIQLLTRSSARCDQIRLPHVSTEVLWSHIPRNTDRCRVTGTPANRRHQLWATFVTRRLNFWDSPLSTVIHGLVHYRTLMRPLVRFDPLIKAPNSPEHSL